MTSFLRRSAARLLLGILIVFASVAAAGAQAPARIRFTVSVPERASHLFRVVMHCEGLTPGQTKFHMPVWTPGYYGLFDFAGNVKKLVAATGDGVPLPVDKDGPNGWVVSNRGARTVELQYDVLATRSFVANAYVDETRGYILPGALFLYIPGHLREPATVTLQAPPEWPDVATGLDRLGNGNPPTFTAANFDVLYDSPILIGKLESLPSFDIRGVKHEFIGYQLGDFDKAAFIDDLKAVVEAGVNIIGEVPYPHYVFIGIGPGQGGIEHLNSAAVPFKGTTDRNHAALVRQLSFLAHEYFHNYNVKRIRPVALGPFDYSKANLTNMLWVSEGFTVYYEYLMLARSGRMTLDEMLDAFTKNIAAYENNPGRLFQSATASSWETWSQGPFGQKPGRVRKSISYYDKGPVLGLLLDFRIRHETHNQRSLDDVMRELYRRYYKELGRGWTDEEFRAVCEKVAGVKLDENFDYASTTKEIDYAKYLAYAGLELDPPTERPEAFSGAILEDVDGRLVVAATEPHSPAANALKAGDVISSVNGTKVDGAGYDAALAAAHPGDALHLSVERAGKASEVTLTLVPRQQRTWKIHPVASPGATEKAILEAWATGRK